MRTSSLLKRKITVLLKWLFKWYQIKGKVGEYVVSRKKRAFVCGNDCHFFFSLALSNSIFLNIRSLLRF